MATEQKDKKKSDSPPKDSKAKSNSGGGGDSFFRNIGCGCLLIFMLFASFLLGTLYGRKVFPMLFEKAHKGIEAAAEQSHKVIDTADEKIKKNEE